MNNIEDCIGGHDGGKGQWGVSRVEEKTTSPPTPTPTPVGDLPRRRLWSEDWYPTPTNDCF